MNTYTRSVSKISDFIKINFDTGMMHHSWPYINFALFILSFIIGIGAMMIY